MSVEPLDLEDDPKCEACGRPDLERLTYLGWKRLLVENGHIEAEAEAPSWFLRMLIGCFGEFSEEAPNYMSASVQVKQAGEIRPWSFEIAVVKPGKPGPHAKRTEAEAEIERLRKLIESAVDEGRNALPDASDDEAAAIEAFALRLLRSVSSPTAARPEASDGGSRAFLDERKEAE